MPISRFDYQIQKALESVVKNDFNKAKLQFAAMETNIKKDIQKTNNIARLSDIKRIRLIRAGLFNKKIKI